MTAANRDQVADVLDVARYLRAVRPLDPEELGEYVDGGLSSAHVRSVLQAHAYDLRIRERADGRFIPVDDRQPFAPTFDGVTEFPRAYEAVVLAALAERYGTTWFEGRTGDRLRRAIRRFKAAYFAGEDVAYDEDTSFGYAIYHAPAYYAAVQYVLDQLGQASLCPPCVRILDVGAGVGGPSIGIHDYFDSKATVRYEAVEPSPARELLTSMLAQTGRNFSWSVIDSPIESFEPSGTYDVVIFSNVVNELDSPEQVIGEFAEHLAPDGSIICVSPADRRTSLGLRRIERDVVDFADTFDVFAPTLRLWEGERPRDECWSFDERPPIRLPRMQQLLDEGRRCEVGDRDPATGEFVRTDVRFSYTILRTDGRRRIAYRASRGAFVPFAESEGHVTQRVDVVTVKLSGSLAEPGTHPVYRIGDGSQRHPHFAVVTRETSRNRALQDAAYGDVLCIAAGLLLWNDDEGAFNVVVDGETSIYPVEGSSDD